MGSKLLFPILVSIVFLSSCGLPDVVPLLEEPVLSSSNQLSGTRASSTDYAAAGLLFFYKHYQGANPNTSFETDFSTWLGRSVEDQLNVSRSLGFRLVYIPGQDFSSSGVAPSVSILTGLPPTPGSWSVPFTQPTSGEEPGILHPDSSVMKRFRRLTDSSLLQTAAFTGPESDYSNFTGDLPSGFDPLNSIHAGYVVMMYGFSITYGNTYSRPVKMGLYQVNIK